VILRPTAHSLETLTWAAAILAITSRIRVYATVNSQFIHPVWAAKQGATCNDIGEGRFGGINIVSGYNPTDFEAFGVEMLPHDERYDYTAEWATIVKRLWRDTEPFDFEGKYFQLKNTQLLPPSRDPIPGIINAGNSPAGKAFSAKHVDAWFTMLFRKGDGFGGIADELADFRKMAGRDVKAYASGHIICRETEEETNSYYQSIVANADWGAFNHFRNAMLAGNQSVSREELEAVGERYITGMSTCLFRGTPEHIVEEFCMLRDAGLNGIALAMHDYIEDIPVIRDKLLPLMARNGLRVK
jgi:dimethylsulfone monooxygenase